VRPDPIFMIGVGLEVFSPSPPFFFSPWNSALPVSPRAKSLFPRDPSALAGRVSFSFLGWPHCLFQPVGLPRERLRRLVDRISPTFRSLPCKLTATPPLFWRQPVPGSHLHLLFKVSKSSFYLLLSVAPDEFLTFLQNPSQWWRGAGRC